MPAAGNSEAGSRLRRRSHKAKSPAAAEACWTTMPTQGSGSISASQSSAQPVAVARRVWRTAGGLKEKPQEAPSKFSGAKGDGGLGDGVAVSIGVGLGGGGGASVVGAAVVGAGRGGGGGDVTGGAVSGGGGGVRWSCPVGGGDGVIVSLSLAWRVTVATKPEAMLCRRMTSSVWLRTRLWTSMRERQVRFGGGAPTAAKA
jgi:hypothetical protein